MPHITLHHPIFGSMRLREAAGAVVALDWLDDPAEAGEIGAADDPTPLLRRAAAGLDRYFETGDLPDDLPLAPVGTEYQARVWAALRAIARGETRTYGEIAAAVGGSARSVGTANRTNPIPILIPCHRVCAAGGIGGYAGSTDDSGWGLAMKRRLLTLEGAPFGP